MIQMIRRMIAMSKEYAIAKLQSESFKKTEKGATVKGVIATTARARYRAIRFSERALKQMARKIKNGKDVQVRAGHDSGLAIGKPLSAEYDYSEKRVISTFEILEGLKLQRSGFAQSGYAESDDYLKAVEQGVLTDLSCGVEVKRLNCSYCNEEMIPKTMFGFLMGFQCKNGHMPGQTIYVGKGKRGKEESKKKKPGYKKYDIEGIMDSVDIFEFSLVGRAAIPGSEILSKIKQAFSNNELDDEQIDFLTDRFALTFSDEGIDFDKVTLDNLNGVYLMDNTEALKKQIEDKDALIQKMSANLQAADDQNNEMDSKLLDLEAENQDLRVSKKDVEALEEKIEKLEAEAKDYNANSHKIVLYDQLVDKAIAEAVFQWTRAESATGRKPTPEAQEKQEADYRRIGNYETILTHADQDRRTATRAQGQKVDRFKTAGTPDLDVSRLS